LITADITIQGVIPNRWAKSSTEIGSSASIIISFGRKWDIPPARFYEEPTPSGPNEGLLVTREEMDILLDEYYLARGWDKNGIPMKETLEEVGLGDIAEVIEHIRTSV
jgi:hypothetical protein